MHARKLGSFKLVAGVAPALAGGTIAGEGAAPVLTLGDGTQCVSTSGGAAVLGEAVTDAGESQVGVPVAAGEALGGGVATGSAPAGSCPVGTRPVAGGTATTGQPAPSTGGQIFSSTGVAIPNTACTDAAFFAGKLSAQPDASKPYVEIPSLNTDWHLDAATVRTPHTLANLPQYADKCENKNYYQRKPGETMLTIVSKPSLVKYVCARYDSTKNWVAVVTFPCDSIRSLVGAGAGDEVGCVGRVCGVLP